jgi:DNA-binding winged helix-turn-helix (wHTH) protein
MTMDQVVREVLLFERFALDLNRGCVLIGSQIIDLRPKTFEVLRHLVANAGHLVSKDDLYGAAWPDVIVGDDSLSQCIHELRQLLGDTDRRLIKTISRRGYLLDAQPVAPAAASPSVMTGLPPATADGPITAASRSHRRVTAIVTIFALLVIAAGSLMSLSGATNQTVIAAMRRLAPRPENLLLPEDAKRLAALATERELPIPIIHIGAAAEDLPDAFRKFIGVWVSESGWIGSGRQFMVIVTGIGRDGAATGYFVNGPAKPNSVVQNPAFSMSFAGHVDGATLRHDGGSLGLHLASLKADGRMEFRKTWPRGATSVVILDPFWLLPPRDRSIATTLR